MSDTFISYAREDRKAAQRLAEALEAQGWSVWWDTRLKAGEVWDEVIERELAAAHCVVVLWSKASVQSHWVREEARKGLERRILVPLKIENVQLPLPFGGIQTVDLIGWKGQRGHPGFKKLMADVTGIIGPPPSPLPSPDGPQPEPVPPTPNNGIKHKETSDFPKNTWSQWFKHYVETGNSCLAAITDWLRRKWHPAMAGGIALLVFGVVAYSLYNLQPKPQPPDRDDKPPEWQEVACYDQDAVNSLINRLQMLGEAYKKI